MKKNLKNKKNKLLLVTIIGIPLILIDPYNWWLIAFIILTFLIIAFMTPGKESEKRKL